MFAPKAAPSVANGLGIIAALLLGMLRDPGIHTHSLPLRLTYVPHHIMQHSRHIRRGIALFPDRTPHVAAACWRRAEPQFARRGDSDGVCFVDFALR